MPESRARSGKRAKCSNSSVLAIAHWSWVWTWPPRPPPAFSSTVAPEERDVLLRTLVVVELVGGDAPALAHLGEHLEVVLGRAVAVVAGVVGGNAVADLAEQPADRQAGDLAGDVPEAVVEVPEP